MSYLEDISTGLQYRLLRWISPPARNAPRGGGAYAGKSKIRVLLGEKLVSQLAGKVVLDFGCGAGKDAVEVARLGATQVIGLDIQLPLLDEARRLAEEQGVAHLCTFVSTPPTAGVDAIISLDSFEHFADPALILRIMYNLLKPGGFVAFSFGWTWYHPTGGHLFSVFPWAHLIFSERALIRWRSDIRSDGATRFSEVSGGLNQMTISRFERIVSESPFGSIDLLEEVPIRKLQWLHNRWTREFTTATVRGRLVRKPD